MYSQMGLELIKLAQVIEQAAQKAPGLLSKLNAGTFKNKHLIGAGLLGAGISSVGGQAMDDWRMGRVIRKQNDAQQTF